MQEKKYFICVYAICKNEEKFVDRWMDSMQEADLIVVTDTGSDDDTVKKLRERGALVYEEKIDPWRFDVARNLSLSYVPDYADIAVCTDLDEVFRPGWRKILDEVWNPDLTMVNYLYNWSINPDGTPHTQFTYFKIHAKKHYRWSCPVHEFLRFTPATPGLTENKIFVPEIILDHYPDSTKSRSSYMNLLKLGVAENPQDDRMAYYLGREYMYVGDWQNCIDTLTAYLKLESALWREERCAAMRWIAQSYIHLQQHSEAYSWYLRAIAEVPYMREPYIECAKLAYSISDWATSLFMTTEALKIKEKSRVYVNQGYAWDFTPNDLAAIALYRLGNYQEALDHARLALEFAPTDPRLKNNLELIKERIVTIPSPV